MQEYKISIDPVLAREAQSVFQDLGLSLSAAVAVFLRQTVRQRTLPFQANESEFTDEELADAHRRGMEQIRTGKYVRVCLEDLGLAQQ